MSDQNSKLNWLIHPELIFLVLGIFFGLIFCIFIPYGAGFDEETHLVRTFEISGLHFIPNSTPYTLGEFYTLSYQRRYFETPAWDLFSADKFFTKANWQSMAEGGTRSTYFPANYLIGAIVAGMGWRVFDLPILPIVIAIRLAGLAFYIFSCFITIRSLPIGKWIFFIIAFTPMAFFQASTINADGFTLACSYLFIGVIVSTFFRAEKKISIQDAWKIALVSILVGCTKPGTILLLLLLFVLIHYSFESNFAKRVFFAGILASLVISIGWMLFVVFNANIWSGTKTFSGQLNMVLANFSDFINVYLKGIVLSAKGYYTGWVGVYGYWVGQVPLVVYILFPIAIAVSTFAEQKTGLVHQRGRLALLVIALICLAGIAVFQFIAGYVPGSQVIDKVGRYFLPFLPILFLAASCFWKSSDRLQYLSRILCLVLIVFVMGGYIYGLFRTYYTKCVYAVSPSQPCTLPVYKNVDLANPYLVSLKSNDLIEQSFQPECSELTSVSVYLDGISAVGDSQINFSLLDSDKNLIATQLTSITSLSEKTYLEMPVDLRLFTTQKELWLQVSLSPLANSQDNVQLVGRKGATIYPAGILLLNKLPQEGDLIFQYTCADDR